MEVGAEAQELADEQQKLLLAQELQEETFVLSEYRGVRAKSHCHDPHGEAEYCS